MRKSRFCASAFKDSHFLFIYTRQNPRQKKSGLGASPSLAFTAVARPSPPRSSLLAPRRPAVSSSARSVVIDRHLKFTVLFLLLLLVLLPPLREYLYFVAVVTRWWNPRLLFAATLVRSPLDQPRTFPPQRATSPFAAQRPPTDRQWLRTRLPTSFEGILPLRALRSCSPLPVSTRQSPNLPVYRHGEQRLDGARDMTGGCCQI